MLVCLFFLFVRLFCLLDDLWLVTISWHWGLRDSNFVCFFSLKHKYKKKNILLKIIFKNSFIWGEGEIQTQIAHNSKLKEKNLGIYHLFSFLRFKEAKIVLFLLRAKLLWALKTICVHLIVNVFLLKKGLLHLNCFSLYFY